MVTAMMILGGTTTMRCHRTKMGKEVGCTLNWRRRGGQEGFTKVQKERRDVKSEKCRDSWPPVLLRCCKSPDKMEAVGAAPEAGILSRAIIIFFFLPVIASHHLHWAQLWVPNPSLPPSLTSPKPSPQWKLLISEQNPPKSYATFIQGCWVRETSLGWKLFSAQETSRKRS